MKKKVIPVESAKVTDEAAPLKDQVTPRYSLNPELNGNQAMINSDMILNEQAGLLPYSGEHEIEKCKNGCNFSFLFYVLLSIIH